MNLLAEQIKAESLRRLDESELRIRKCIGLLPPDLVWQQPNANTASVGNLVLHLCGNVGQWVLSTLGGAPDHRQRDLEFDPGSAIPVPELLGRLERTMSAAKAVITSMTEEGLSQGYRVQGFAETGTAILVHVVEHFSYHTGQITLHAKLRLEVDTGFYSGQDLNAKG